MDDVSPDRVVLPVAVSNSIQPLQDRYRMLVDSIRDYAIFMLDANGNIVSWNPGAEAIKGYKADEIIGQHFSVFYPADARERRWPEYELQVAALEGRIEDEGWRLRKDGSRFWASIVISALKNTDGTLLGFSKVTRDLTERKAHEERLRESDERFRLLVEAVQDYAIYMLDPSGRIVSWNRGAERIKGYTAGDIIGQHFSKFFLHGDIEDGRPDKLLQEAIRSGSIEHEGWRVRKDGSRFWASATLTALFDAKGRHRGFAKITRDLTQRKQVEALEETGRRVNEFLAMLAHELRNPLAPIRNAVSVMQVAPTEDATTTWARDVIDRQVTHMTRLVDDLLDVSRITSGKITLRCQPVDVNEIAQRAVEVARPMIDARRHSLTVKTADHPLMVDGDPTRLSQIIVNVLNNAAKYTPEGGHIWVLVGEDRDAATVAVRDNGLGISATLLPKVFDLFAQGDRSLARSEGGLGIGLTLARRLVEMHNGTIQAKSDGNNRGSEFTVRLPLLSALSVRRAKEDGDGQVAANTCRVLVVDDNDDSAQTMAMLLELGGHKPLVRHDGPTALTAAVEFRPHLVLLDIGLPEMNGFEVARRMRDMPELAGVILVAMTGYGQEEDRRRTADAGFAYHLVKPIDPAALERVIASAGCED